MNRIDFHSIATILLGGLIDADYSQMDFIYMLFGSFANDNVDFAFDNGLVCKWIKGQSRISPKIISYYNIEKNRDKFCKDIESKLLPYISDVSYAISAIRDLMLCDITTSDEKKDALLTHFDHAPAHFICDVLVYGFPEILSKREIKIPAHPLPEWMMLCTYPCFLNQRNILQDVLMPSLNSISCCTYPVPAFLPCGRFVL